MKSIKDDRRSKFTKMVLKDALLELLKTKPIEKITVSELADKADVNRATLYIHYYDVFDLLEQIENEWLETLNQYIDDFKKETPDAVLEAILNAIYENRKLCEILFGQYGDVRFLERIMHLCGSKVVEFWKRKSRLENLTLELLNAFSMGGNASIIRTWIKGGFPVPPKELLTIMLNLNAKGIDFFIKTS